MDIDIERYGHFSFDMWLTLIRSHPEFKEERNKWMQEYLQLRSPLERIRGVVRQVDIDANKDSEQRGIQYSQIELFREVVGRLQEHLPKDFDWGAFLEAQERLFLHYMPELIDPTIGELFEAIKAQGKHISILSNTAFIAGRSLRKVLVHYGLDKYFSFQLYSDELKSSKPDRSVFRKAFWEASALRPLQAKDFLHIGDNPIADYQGALDAGYSALLVER